MFRPKILYIFLLCTMTLIGSTPQKTANQASLERPETINASYVSRPINIPSVVAQEKKMFADKSGC